MLNSKRDNSSKEGAQADAMQIYSFWKSRGVNIKVRVEQVAGDERHPIFGVRSEGIPVITSVSKERA